MHALFVILLLTSGVGAAQAQSPSAKANCFIDAGRMALQPNLVPASEWQGAIDYSTGQPTSFAPPRSAGRP